MAEIATLAIIVAAFLAHPLAGQTQWPTKSWPSAGYALSSQPKCLLRNWEN